MIVKGSESIRVFSARERLFDSYKDVLALQLSASRVWIQNEKVFFEYNAVTSRLTMQRLEERWIPKI